MPPRKKKATPQGTPPENDEEPPNAGGVPTWVVFVRTWVGYSDTFPYEKFDHVPDREFGDALEELAREYIRETGGPAAWRKAAVAADIKQQAVWKQRERGSPTPPDGSALYRARRYPTADELHEFYRAEMNAGGDRLLKIVGSTAGWHRMSGVTPRNGPYIVPASYLATGLTRSTAVLVAQRLNQSEIRTSSPGVRPHMQLAHTTRFGAEDSARWTTEAWSRAIGHSQDRSLRGIRSLAATEVAIVEEAARRATPAAAAPTSNPRDFPAVQVVASDSVRPDPVIPALDMRGPGWILSREAAAQEGVKTATLSNHRSIGWKSPDGLSGQDPAGRQWRKATTNAQVRYLASTLRNPKKRAESEPTE